MKVTPKGAADSEISQVIQNGKKVVANRSQTDGETQKSGGSASVNISPQARQLQRVAELARKGDDLRAEKVKALKEKIDGGDYSVAAGDLADDIARSEVARLLEKK